MTEIAYSTELHRKISKVNIRTLQAQDEIHDPHAFICNDTKCQTELSCACWDESKEYQREPFFYLSHRSKPHVFNCDYVSVKEIKEAIEIEKEEIHSSQTTGSSIVLDNPKAYTKKINLDLEDNTKNEDSNAKPTNNSNNKDNPTTTTKKHYSNLASFVAMYQDSKIDNDYKIKLNFSFEERKLECLSEIKGTKGDSTFNELFCPISKPVAIKKFHIYYGKAKLIQINENGLCKLIFTDNNIIQLFFNINSYPRNTAIKKYAGEELSIDNLEEITVYFEGTFAFINNKLKAIPLTKQFYRSLYLVVN